MMRWLLILTGGGLLAVGIWLFANSSPKDEIARGHSAARVQELLPLVEKGDLGASVELADLLRQGRGIKADPVRAFQLYMRAAETGDNRSRYAIGSMIENGEGTKPNLPAAVDWYRLAARQGQLAEAEFALGRLYYRGLGVRQDFGEAFSWYLKAARQGHAAAQYLVAGMYADGWVVGADPIEAYAWFTLAIPKTAEAQAFDADFDPGRARALLAKRMSSADISQGERRAVLRTAGR